MTILGIDLGLKKTGLAIAVGPLAEPLEVVHHKSEEQLIFRVLHLISKHRVEKLVLGLSENKMAAVQKNFAAKLKEKTNLPVNLIDETLTTKDAQRFSIEAGIKRKKRKKLEDAFAAALLLQNYLNSFKK